MIRNIRASDLPELRSIISTAPNFSIEEQMVAIELVNDAIKKSDLNGYFVRVAELDAAVAGYYCIGQRGFTDSTYDLYWIVVDSKSNNKGIGKALITDAEQVIKAHGGSLVLAETSSRPDYVGTRAFYSNSQYQELSVIKDFYSKGDDLVMFGKYL